MQHPRFRATVRAIFPPLLALSGSAAAGAAQPTLRIHTDPVAATVLDSAGRALGTTPFELPVPARRQRDLLLAAPGYDTAVVTVGPRTRSQPFPKFASATATYTWTPSPPTMAVTLAPTAAAPPALAVEPATAPDSLSPEVAAVVLAEFARAAEAAGCEPLLADAWRDAALLLGGADRPVPDSVRRMARDEVARVSAEVREACARPSARMARLREIRESLGRPPEPDPAALLFAPVYFDAGRWEVAEDSVRERLRALGRHLAETGGAVTLRVEGFSDPAGTEAANRELGFQRALAVLRELRRGGLSGGCCVAVSHGADPGRQVAPGASGSAPGARWNRRVTFALDYRSTP